MEKPRGEGFSLTWWSGEEEDGDDASSAPLSLSPRSSSALLPESTVVTEEQGRDWKPMMRGNFAARKKRKKTLLQETRTGRTHTVPVLFRLRGGQVSPRRRLTLVGRVLEEHLDELPVDDAVVHREDMEPRLGIHHRHGGVGRTGTAERTTRTTSALTPQRPSGP